MTSKIISVFICIVVMSSVGFYVYAASERTIVNGTGNIANYAISKLPKKQDHELRIIEKEGQYYWASNGNKLLIRTDRIIPGPYGTGMTYSFFVNPEGYGQIVIRHDETTWKNLKGSDQAVHNYLEYRSQEDGSVIPYSGYTKPYPFPGPDFLQGVAKDLIYNR